MSKYLNEIIIGYDWTVWDLKNTLPINLLLSPISFVSIHYDIFKELFRIRRCFLVSIGNVRLKSLKQLFVVRGITVYEVSVASMENWVLTYGYSKASITKSSSQLSVKSSWMYERYYENPISSRRHLIIIKIREEIFNMWIFEIIIRYVKFSQRECFNYNPITSYPYKI